IQPINFFPIQIPPYEIKKPKTGRLSSRKKSIGQQSDLLSRRGKAKTLFCHRPKMSLWSSKVAGEGDRPFQDKLNQEEDLVMNNTIRKAASRG
ncbi:hypothetical protein, partial [Dethiosulfovibrio salsuginis]|uniref:hypothetical protein n=1 Tax=Dethiosulfovibrio salsuginis TaxID=561720 RepID=UPI001F17AB52